MKPTIPKGYYRLRKGTVIKKGDKFHSGETPTRWFYSTWGLGSRVGWDVCMANQIIYIRLKSKARK